VLVVHNIVGLLLKSLPKVMLFDNNYKNDD